MFVFIHNTKPSLWRSPYLDLPISLTFAYPSLLPFFQFLLCFHFFGPLVYTTVMPSFFKNFNRWNSFEQVQPILLQWQLMPLLQFSAKKEEGKNIMEKPSAIWHLFNSTHSCTNLSRLSRLSAWLKAVHHFLEWLSIPTTRHFPWFKRIR